jgi:uncharacterized protein involved in outer membrane biogenesis
MPRRRKIAITVALIVVTGLLFTAFVLPSIVRSQLEKQIGSATDRKCTVAAVAINPLKWSVAVRGVQLSEKGSNAAFVSFSSLQLRISPTSVWRLAPVVADIKLTSPYVHLQRDAPNRYNFSDILAKNANKPKDKNDKPAKFSLNNIVIENGRVEFDDNALTRPNKHLIDGIIVQIPFISSISYFADKYIDPKLAARVNGAPFTFAGKLKPFEKGLEATLSANLQDVDIPFYAAYFPQELPVQIKQGTLATALKISHHLDRSGKADISITGTAGIRNLEIQEKTGAPLLSLAAVTCDIKQLALLTRRYEITGLSIAAPKLFLHGDKNGIWNLSRLNQKKPAETAAEKPLEADKGAAGQYLSIQTLQLSDGTVDFKDVQPPGGIAAEIGRITFKLDNFSTKGEILAAYSLSLQTDRKEAATANGTIAMEPLAISSRIALTNIVLEAYYPYLAALLTEPVRARMDFSSDLAYSANKGLTLEQSLLRLKDIKVPFGKHDAATLPLIVAEGGSLNLLEKKFTLAKVTASGGTVKISRDPAGKLSTSLLFKDKAPSPAPVKTKTTEEKPFAWKIGAAAINGLKLAFTDGTIEENPGFEFNSITASLASITGPALSDMPLTLNVKYGSKGSFGLKGRVKSSPLGFKGELSCRNLPFVDFDTYLPEGVNIVLLDGKLDTNIFLDLAMNEKNLIGTFRGEGGIRDFYSVDAEAGEDLLKWESLLFEKFSGTVAPFSLQMNGMSLNNYYARVIVNKNGRMNLQDIYKPPVKGQASAVAAAKPEPAPRESSIKIDSVTFSEGTLDFSDRHLNRDFSTTMLRLGGRVSGLSSETGSAADVDLRGNLENHSPLKIFGKVNPLVKDLYLDMEIDFNDIELSPLTPYSGTYLGYVIDKGKLSLALKYTVAQKNLTAENKVFLDQFTFGEKVESAKATSLPVRLGIALLKDRNGEIHLDLPLSGRTDSPKFSIWGLVGQVLKNLLVKAATSPLSLLQASFGGADFSSIDFASGTSRLSSSEAEKLRTLAKALSERPGIRLEITGFADRERDPEGFRNELLLRKIKNEKFLSLAKEKRESGGLSHDAVEVTDAEYPKWLKSVYEKEKFPRPRTAIGTLKTLPDSEMKKLILANTAISEQQLRGLARERAVVVMDFLLKEGKLPQDRLFEKSGDPFAPPAKDARAGGRVEFGVVAK